MIETISNNLNCLSHILNFNIAHNILFFRISSDLIPFASHPVCRFDWQNYFLKEFKRIGHVIHRNQMRISMHPDQFTLINSLKEEIYDRSVRELLYHCDVLDLMELDQSHKVQIHVGGVYGNKRESISRFIDRYHQLDPKITTRLVIENDHKSYSIKDCLTIHRETKVPVLFDVFHHRLNSNGESLKEVLGETKKTWKKKDGIPMVDYSTQNDKKPRGSHAHSIDKKDFQKFLQESFPFDFDLMFEIKDKEKSVLKAREMVSMDSRFFIAPDVIH
jgi:UV DNA damage endonuclease